MKFIYTDQGLALKNRLEKVNITFTRCEGGEGFSATPSMILELNKKQELQIENITFDKDMATIELLLSNLEVSSEYRLRQIGIYAKETGTDKEILYLIGQDEVGERIPAATERNVEITFYVSLKVGNTDSIFFEPQASSFLKKAGNAGNTIVEYAVASELEELQSGETLGSALSKIAKAVTSLKAHMKHSICNESGVHGFRYYNEQLQIMNEEAQWTDMALGGTVISTVSPDDVDKLWIDIGNGGVMKYYDAQKEEWTAVAAVWG